MSDNTNRLSKVTPRVEYVLLAWDEFKPSLGAPDHVYGPFTKAASTRALGVALERVRPKGWACLYRLEAP